MVTVKKLKMGKVYRWTDRKTKDDLKQSFTGILRHVKQFNFCQALEG